MCCQCLWWWYWSLDPDLEGIQGDCWDCAFRQLVPDPYCRWKKGFLIHSGSAEWYHVPRLVSPSRSPNVTEQVRCWNGNQGMDYLVHHGSFGSGSPFTKLFPPKPIHHRCDATCGVIVIRHEPSCSSLSLFYFVYIFLCMRIPDSGCIFNLGSY